MSDPNAPSWLNADPAPASSTSVAASAEKAPKPAGVFKMFSKEAATAHVQKTAVDHGTSNAQSNMSSAPDDGFTPAWATAKAYTPPHDVESGGGVSTAAVIRPGGSSPKPLDIDPETLKKMQFYHRILRVLYMLAALVMGIAAGLSLVAQTNISAAFFAIYVLFFCLLMCCFEVGLHMISSFIAVNFGFMYTLTGRVIFLLFVGFMSYSLSIFGKAAMALLYLVGFIHAIIMCRFPKFSQYVRERDYTSAASRK